MVSTHASAGDATVDSETGESATGFNSRVRGGRDSWGVRIFPKGGVSTHASAGDATALEFSLRGIVVFQLTRPRGTRQIPCRIFIS